MNSRASDKRPSPTDSVDEALLNHLALPLQLPQRQDLHLDAVEAALVDHLVAAAKHMRDLSGHPAQALWDSVSRSFRASRTFVSRGRLEKASLAEELRRVVDFDFLFLHVRSQNAAVFIQQSVDE